MTFVIFLPQTALTQEFRTEDTEERSTQGERKTKKTTEGHGGKITEGTEKTLEIPRKAGYIT